MTAAFCACGGDEPLARTGPPASDVADHLLLHLPDIHCAGCIAAVEDTLGRRPGVVSARVNLGLKRVAVKTSRGVGAGALVAALAQAGIEAQELDPALLSERRDAEGADLLMRLSVAGFAMMNVMLLSVAVWSGAADSLRQLFHLISALITVPAVAFAGRPFFASAAAALRAGRLGMDVPISLAILLATAMSLAVALGGGSEHAWFDAALSLTFFLLAGRYLDHKGRASASSAARALAALNVPRALKLDGEGDGARSVASADLRPGDRVRVLPGMVVPADGMVEAGESDLDRSAMTGESAPAFAGPGAEVLAGETVLTGALVVEVTRAGQDTGLARMTELVAQAEEARGAYLSIADRVARAYVPIVHILAAGAFAAWLWASGDAWLAAGIAIAVLIITCPCALGLAVPAVSVAATGRLFRAGLLVKERTALERLARIDTVVFDKTGTLTTGRPEVTAGPDGAALEVAMGLAACSAHPYAQAVLAHGRARGLTPAAVTEAREVAGFGIRGSWQGRAVSLGRGAAADASASVLDLGCGASEVFRFRESLRDGAAEAVAGLRDLGCRVVVMSGDTAQATARIAAAAGIDAAEGRLSPQDKAAAIGRLKADGAGVLMVGDGLNDTAALAAADAAISLGSALDAPRNAADIVVMTQGLEALPLAVATARRARRRMSQNFAIAAGYNLVAVPVALAGLATPLLAALAMSLSSVTVSANAARLAR